MSKSKEILDMINEGENRSIYIDELERNGWRKSDKIGVYKKGESVCDANMIGGSEGAVIGTDTFKASSDFKRFQKFLKSM